MRLAPGMRMGPYEIVAAIGAGGMGEVYRARDTRLGREVAIKVLASGFSSDSDRLRRFEHEARGASALNHVNTFRIHDSRNRTNYADSIKARTITSLNPVSDPVRMPSCTQGLPHRYIASDAA